MKGHWLRIARDNYEAATNGKFGAGTVLEIVAGDSDTPHDWGTEGAKIYGSLFASDDPNEIYSAAGLQIRKDRIDIDAIKAAHPEESERIDAIFDSKSEPVFDFARGPKVGAEIVVTTVKEAVQPAKLAEEMAAEFGGTR